MKQDAEQLLAQYNEQSGVSGKHAYSENLHNDTGCGCCDCVDGMCSWCEVCTLCSSGSCC